MRAASVRQRLVLGDQEHLERALESSEVSQSIDTSFVEPHHGTDRGRDARKTYRFSKDWRVPEAMTFFTKVHPEVARAAQSIMKVSLSDEFIPALVDRQDLQLEELTVPEPIGLPPHRLDLVVRPLQRTRADHHVVVGQQTTAVRRQRLGHLLQDLDPRRLRTLDPPLE